MIPPLRILALGAAALLPSPLWSQGEDPRPVLPKEALEKVGKDVEHVYVEEAKLGNDLQLSIEDQRVLLHLPKRGFPNLAALLDYPNLELGASTLVGNANVGLKTYSAEESYADYLAAQAMVNRVRANVLASFYLVKELAPTPEAMKLEEQAEVLWREMVGDYQVPPKEDVMQKLRKVRAFFDRLKDLPKLTPEQWAEERVQTAVLIPAEYPGAGQANRPVWPDTFLDWHRKWNHEGYILAFSGADGPQSFVVRQRGAVFAWNQAPRVKSGTGNQSVESRLSENELRGLQGFLPKLPPSDPDAKDARYIVSFSQNGQWITRAYHDLPTGSPFPQILRRMENECAGFVAYPGEGFQKTVP